MKMIHATDTDIQTYVFDISNVQASIIAHINSCEHCKKNATAYDLFSEEIKKTEVPTLTIDISKILEPIPKEVLQIKPVKNLRLHIISSAIIACISVFIWIFDSSLDIPVNSTHVIISTAVFFVFIWCLDSYKSYQKKMKHLSFS